MNTMIFDVFIALLLVFLIYYRNMQIIDFLNTNLGRFIFIIFILLLSVRHILWGIAALIVFFILRENYYIEGLDVDGTKADDNISIHSPSLVDVNEVPIDGSITVKSVQSSITSETITKSTSPTDISSQPIQQQQQTTSVPSMALDNWRKQNCSKDNLPIFNNKIIPVGDLSKVFKNFSFISSPCNPCDTNCKFNITSTDKFTELDRVKPISSNSLPASQTRFGNASQTMNFSSTDPTKAGSGLNLTPFPVPVGDSPSNLVNKSAPNANKISPAMAPSPSTTQSMTTMPR